MCQKTQEHRAPGDAGPEPPVNGSWVCTQRWFELWPPVGLPQAQPDSTGGPVEED